MVRIQSSILPLPRWLPTMQSKFSCYLPLHNHSNRCGQDGDRWLVLIRFGDLKSAMYVFKNHMTLAVIKLRKTWLRSKYFYRMNRQLLIISCYTSLFGKYLQILSKICHLSFRRHVFYHNVSKFDTFWFFICFGTFLACLDTKTDIPMDIRPSKIERFSQSLMAVRMLQRKGFLRTRT